MENPKLKDLVVSIDDTSIKEEPPKPKKENASRPRKPSKFKVDKEQGLKLLAQIANSMPWNLQIFDNFWSLQFIYGKALQPDSTVLSSENFCKLILQRIFCTYQKGKIYKFWEAYRRVGNNYKVYYDW